MKPTTVDEYIDAAPEAAQAMLRELRALLKDVAPDARDALKWRSPVLEEKRILFAYSAHKAHMNFMPTRASLEPFREELAAYATGKDTIKLPYDKPLPTALLRRIALHRVSDVRERCAVDVLKRGCACILLANIVHDCMTNE